MPEIFEKYPMKIVLTFWLATLVTWWVGWLILDQLHWGLGVLYILYVLVLEFKIYPYCACCCYYGKRCAFGRGLIAAKFLKKRDSKLFCSKKVGWKEMFPSILVILIPVVTGIYLLVKDFNWFGLVLVVFLALIWFVFNPLFFGKLACCHCKQGSICCPAKSFFDKM